MNESDPKYQRAVSLFWARSARYLRGGEYKDLSAIWLECLADADLVPHEFLMSEPSDPSLEVKALGKFALELKEEPDGSLTGYAACYSKDLVNDVIEPGAFEKSLAEHEAFQRRHKSASLLPLLWQHDKQEPIGAVLSAKEDRRRGLRCRYRLDRESPRGNQAYKGLRDGYLSFSIGYKPTKYAWRGSERHLQEIALAEVSAVTFPANRDARAVTEE